MKEPAEGKTLYLKKGISFPVTDFTDFRIQMLNWANRFSIFCFLDNQQYNFSSPAFECLLAAGCKKNIQAPAGHAFESLRDFYGANRKEWLFGHFGYDLKNETERLDSANFDGIRYSDLHFFIPEFVVRLTQTEVSIFCDKDAGEIFRDIRSYPLVISSSAHLSVSIQNRIEKEEYIIIIEKLREYILRGDCYEINFCQEFFSQNASLDPLVVYERLVGLSPNPFSVLYKMNALYCLCASPERYLRKSGKKIISQPIKGTSKRNLANAVLDEANKQYLAQNDKERSENIMVVDLVRNDLSRVCIPGSVKVEELFGLYSFPQVHQMISTVSGELEDDVNWVDCIRATFPMGSMTGAPKKRVMELIDQYEKTRRGLFSGAIGYLDPNGDFDFNVVIRSVFYNAETKYLSFQTGSAITYYSDPEKEYEECLLKAAAIKSILA